MLNVSELRTLDVFCGAGGSSAGAQAAGADIVAGIDLDPVATATYAANFPSAHVVTQRAEDINVPALRRKTGPIDLLLASPECRSHSCAKGNAPRDEESRATAFLVIEYVRHYRPRWLVVENVVHMRPWSRYGELKQTLQDVGYQLREHILDASHFGVPQSRRRLILVGDRDRQPPDKVTPLDGVAPTVASILDPPGTWKMSALRHPRRAMTTLRRADRAFAKLGPKASFLLVYYSTDGSGGWQELGRPLRTITTVDRFALVAHDGQEARMRMLQVPELRRAMGLDDDFAFPVGTRRDQVRLLGNGVCPPVMRAVVESLTCVR